MCLLFFSQADRNAYRCCNPFDGLMRLLCPLLLFNSAHSTRIMKITRRDLKYKNRCKVILIFAFTPNCRLFVQTIPPCETADNNPVIKFIQHLFSIRVTRGDAFAQVQFDSLTFCGNGIMQCLTSSYSEQDYLEKRKMRKVFQSPYRPYIKCVRPMHHHFVLQLTKQLSENASWREVVKLIDHCQRYLYEWKWRIQVCG